MKNINEKQQWEELKNIKQKRKKEEPNKDGIKPTIGKINKNLINNQEKDTGEIKTKLFLKKLKDKGFYNKNYDYSKIKYIDAETKIIIIDDYGIKHMQKPKNMLLGYKISYESALNKTEYFLKELKERGNYYEEYDYSKVNYIHQEIKVIIINKKLGTEHLITPLHLAHRGWKCTFRNSTDKTDYFIKRAIIIHGNNYDYSFVVYKGNDIPVKIKCKKCNNIFNQTPEKHLNSKHGCPICKQSRGENKIKNILDKLNIDYEIQKRFDDCKNILSLPFDFYLQDQNLLIEYNGIQHYKPIGYFGGEKTFKDNFKKDKIKVDYCKNNNINLLIISYKDFDQIEDILTKQLLITK